MQLSVSDVAELCDVSENKVYKWVQDEGLPAERVNNLYRVNSAELLEWATTRKLPISPAVFQKMNGDSIGRTGLADALELGGVVHDLAGSDRESVLRSLVETLPLPDGFDRDTLVQLLMSREKMGGTAIGDGIAIPHPRSPVVLSGAQRVVRLGFLSQPLDVGAPDGKPVHTLFLMICPTVHDHLQLLSRLASLLRQANFHDLLVDRANENRLISCLRTEELALTEETAAQEA